MALDERSRHDLYLGLEQHLGADRAETLMSLLPPVGWADVATKHDVERECALIRADMGAMEHRFEATLEAGLHRTTRSLAAWLFTSLIAMTTLFLTALAVIR